MHWLLLQHQSCFSASTLSVKLNSSTSFPLAVSTFSAMFSRRWAGLDISSKHAQSDFRVALFYLLSGGYISTASLYHVFVAVGKREHCYFWTVVFRMTRSRFSQPGIMNSELLRYTINSIIFCQPLSGKTLLKWTILSDPAVLQSALLCATGLNTAI